MNLHTKEPGVSDRVCHDVRRFCCCLFVVVVVVVVVAVVDP